MSLNLSSAALRNLVTLAEKRERLTSELSAIEAQIAATLGGTPIAKVKVKTERAAKAPKKRGKRGAVKELILAGLKEAGEAGIAVKHLAAKLALKPQNLHVWFHTTGKKSGLVEAAGKGIYRLKQAIGVEAPKIEVPKPAATRKTRKSPTKAKGKSNKKA
jgi:hypothetical protein